MAGPRPDARPRWPGDRKAAVWIVLNIESFQRGRPGPSLQPHLAQGEDIANSGWREYGNRAAFWRLLDLFTDLAVPVTAAVNGETCDRHPDVVRAVADAGWAVMAHGLDNSTPHHGLPVAVERERITRTVAQLEHAVGRQPLGWLTPGFGISESTDQLVCEAGLRYTADRGDDDVTHWLEQPSGRLLSVPYHLETNDISLLLSSRYTADQFADAIVNHVAQLCAEPRDGTVAGIGLHTFLVGQPGRIAALQTCLQRLAAMPDAWMCTGDEIYAASTEGKADL